jgi:mycoredoxin
MVELFATRSCPFCAEVRDRLEWDGVAYVEYDVEADAEARKRLGALAGPNPLVPVLVEDGNVTQIGAAGRGCSIGTR